MGMAFLSQRNVQRVVQQCRRVARALRIQSTMLHGFATNSVCTLRKAIRRANLASQALVGWINRKIGYTCAI